jgi:hypothetical protein
MFEAEAEGDGESEVPKVVDAEGETYILSNTWRCGRLNESMRVR